MSEPDDDALLRPWIREARGALQALQRGQLEAALHLSKEIPSTTPDAKAWARYVDGLLARRAHDLPAAESALSRAAAMAEDLAKRAADAAEARRLYRLAALSYLRLGSVYLDQGDAARALRTFELAAELRDAHGSRAERWESAIAIRSAHDRAGDLGEALQWALKALELAETVEQDTERCAGQSWSAMARSLLPLGRYKEAAAAALNARGYWGHVDAPRQVARADEDVGRAMLAWARSTLQREPAAARARLEEAHTRLAQAARAFGECSAVKEAEACLAASSEAESLLQDLPPRLPAHA